MSTPAELPPAPAKKPPLGKSFFVALLTPLALMASIVPFLNGNSALAHALLVAAGVATLICSIICAIKMARLIAAPKGSIVGWSVLMFLAAQAFYAVCFFVGCSAALMLS